MKRRFFLTAVVTITMAVAVCAQDTDSLRVEHMHEVVVSGVRASKDAPFAVANISKQELQEHSRTGRELPFLLARTPGIIAWGENGLGTGTTYMRIRGAADSRINVTLDDVALNSPEDQCVFWANMNSYASLLGSVQVQRGVGTSTNGDGAFGGTVALSTAAPFLTPRAELSYSYGSYNTMNYGGALSTGLLLNRFIVDGAWHQTQTDGFLHGTKGRSGSYYGGLTFNVSDHLIIRYKNIGNYEFTGQAWNGVTAGDNDLSLMDGTYGTETGIHTYKDMYACGLGKYNTLYESLCYDADGGFARDADGNYMTLRYPYQDGYWPRTTDNFWQNHNLLSAAWDISDRWNLGATLHYTYGYGYYEEFRYRNKLKKFGLENFTTSDGSTIKKADFIRQKGLGQHTYGLVANAKYSYKKVDITTGLNLQQFRGNHFGYVTYTSEPELSAAIIKDGRYQYYDSGSRKYDYSAFAKAAYYFVNTDERSFSAFADAQYRFVHYATDGINDKFYEENSRYYNQPLDILENYHFFNPKFGINARYRGHRYYLSIANAHCEPERNNFTDNGSYPPPKPESVIDVEVGYQYTARRWNVGFNFYSMAYKNQLVQTGALSDIGEKLTTNIKSSDRLGVELTARWDITKWLAVEGNAAISRSKIHDFDEVVEDWDDWGGNPDAAALGCDGDGDGMRTIHYDRSTLAFSPTAIVNGFVDFHTKGFKATWHTNYVSRQYLDNTENLDRSLPAFSASNLHLSYTLRAKPHESGCAFPTLRFREVVFGVDLTNLFNARYASNGWVYSAIYGSGGHTNDNRYYQIGFIPSAGFTAMGNVTLRF